MNEQEKQDLRNSLYRAQFMKDHDWDPGDIEGPQSSNWPIYLILVYLAYLTHAHLTT